LAAGDRIPPEVGAPKGCGGVRARPAQGAGAGQLVDLVEEKVPVLEERLVVRVPRVIPRRGEGPDRDGARRGGGVRCDRLEELTNGEGPDGTSDP